MADDPKRIKRTLEHVTHGDFKRVLVSGAIAFGGLILLDSAVPGMGKLIAIAVLIVVSLQSPLANWVQHLANWIGGLA